MMDRDDLELFERSLRAATEQHSGADLDAALTDLGWRDAVEVDPRAAVSLLFELQGAANATSSALDQLIAVTLGLDPDESGIVLPTLGTWAPPGSLVGDRLTVVSGLGSAALATRETTVVVASVDGEEIAVVVPTADLDLQPIHGIDPRLGWVEVNADAIAVTDLGSPLAGWDDAVGLAQTALGHELIGASRRMLEQAREHALERIQFGQPIAMFQALRHRMAETYIAIETADAMLEAAWLDPSPLTSAMAKSLAGRGARISARHCQQVLAGIGFTTDHPFHLYLKRTMVLEGLFGTADAIVLDVGRELIRTRSVPTLIEL